MDVLRASGTAQQDRSVQLPSPAQGCSPCAMAASTKTTQSVVITGAASGMGLAIAQVRASRGGWRLRLLDRTPSFEATISDLL
ncbi:hypothetical protein BAUCODRAFT_255306 [Baudoinia panamericana UAMH 10762]|uniref:Uncharacterized protein n=1 Tax=Baudoinia panamericana (strain UAMH 10762) TaxID=717646 RepID=M2N117_BAUPA|nr:uncharacterized protein BAUCODRAFT_255306 [Baudoinia panamericana UAMH 10762]EMC92609.1 hypothetical protein BAUCODRAFT_255306 [Baudoinia panamericana UAMH 10762]